MVIGQPTLTVRRVVAGCLVAATIACVHGCAPPPTDGGPLPFNFHVVADGQLYRSGQPSAESLAAVIDAFGIKTVVNLRGENPDHAWWQQERDACAAAGVRLVNVRMSAHSLPSRENLLLLYDTFTDGEYPMLVHCQAGADRTGAAAAIWRMVVRGEPREQAAAELLPLYLHFRAFAPEIDLLVEVFEPDRNWIETVYDPDAIEQAASLSS